MDPKYHKSIINNGEEKNENVHSFYLLKDSVLPPKVFSDRLFKKRLKFLRIK